MRTKILSIRLKLTRKYIYLLAAVVVLVSLGYLLISSSAKNRGEIVFVQAKRGDVRSSVTTSGVLAGKESVMLRFNSPGKLDFLGVKVGDEVRKGSLVARLDTESLSISLQQARNTLIARQATAEKIEDEVKGHDDDENFEQKETRIAAEVARDNAYDTVKAAEDAMRNAYLYSPIRGIVVDVSPVQGQNVSLSDVVAEVVDESQIYFDAEVDEADVFRISVGQKAEVSLNSYPDQIFQGTVDQILPQTKVLTSGATVVVIRIKMETGAVRFINNLNGQAEIITEQVYNVLTVPLDAVWEDDFVLVKDGEKFKKVPVTFGVESDSDIEVKNGLAEDAEVVSNPDSVDLKLIQD